MKYNIVIALIVLAFTACKKEKTIHQDSHDLAKDTSVALLTRIVYNTNDSLQGKIAEAFSYDEKRLATDTSYFYNPVIVILRRFNYDASGMLASISAKNLTESGEEVVGDVDLTNSGNDFYIPAVSAGLWFRPPTSLEVENGQLRLRNYFDYIPGSNGVEETYTYNSSGNCIAVKSIESIDQGRYGTRIDSSTVEFGAFDNKKNIASALPFWIYGYLMLGNGSRLGLVPGKNNPTTYIHDGNTVNILYEYSNSGYPSAIAAISVLDGINESYKYEYKQFK